ncbi:class I SAM-dependent methyltransferase [Funiculus sociatus GB2-A5]|uniref:Class I SAM-dependent methyltransferase n=1 Tax=Funiculus sociatus GB2-A5 TaxID=2933946 RepID=A0ABV0JSK7_9CYAN|nr:class I SAM-dependent methyltransferase [Trichocoleus sp. FACHB-6]MBD2061871.1 class I SAM-dependent methyltransferase [Trichocoleus sp. FACHB-6]
MLDATDLSPVDFRFDPNLGTSVRDRIRDAADNLIRRPFYKILYKKKFAQQPYPINLVLPAKGMSTLAKRHWVDRYLKIQNSRLLVIGCGTAWDFGSYLRFKPKEIVGIDLYNFEGCWQKVQAYVNKAGLQTKVSFHQADIAELNPKNMGEFDIICSDAVFEHCRDLENVLKTLYNLLRRQGVMYASYGPLWYCWNGDHFSGRDRIEEGYNHLLLDPVAYKDYYYTHLRDADFELQNGGRYIELDLFSKLSSREYFDLYNQVGFRIKSVIVDFHVKANSLRSTPLFKQLIFKFPHLTADDFLIRGHLIILGKH